MKWGVKDVERAIAELVVGELGALVGVFFVDDDEPPGVRGGADGVVDDSAIQHGFRRQQLCQVAHVAARRPRHATLCHVKSRCVGQYRGLHRQLGRVGEGSDLPDILIVLAGEFLLGLRRAVVIDHALDVAGGHRLEADRLAVAHERHRNTGLITVGMRHHHAGFVRLGLQNGSDERVELSVDQHHRLAVLERIECNARAEVNTAGNFDDDVDGLAASQHRCILGDDRHVPRNTRGSLLGCVHRLPLVDSRLAEGAFSVLPRAVGHACQAHACHRSAELQRDGTACRARANDADPDGPAILLTFLQYAVNGLVAL